MSDQQPGQQGMTGYPMQPQVTTEKAYPPPEQYPPQAGQYPSPPQYPPPPQYTQQPTQNIVIRQGQVQPNDYLALAICVTVCCCLPLGIVGIIKSSEVRNRFVTGDYQGAEEASRQAKNWSIAGLVTGSVIIGLVVLLNVIIRVVVTAVVVADSSTSLDDHFDNHFDSHFSNNKF